MTKKLGGDKLVICQSRKPSCRTPEWKCAHSIAHSPVIEGLFNASIRQCTVFTECTEMNHKVRCIRVK